MILKTPGRLYAIVNSRFVDMKLFCSAGLRAKFSLQNLTWRLPNSPPRGIGWRSPKEVLVHSGSSGKPLVGWAHSEPQPDVSSTGLGRD